MEVTINLQTALICLLLLALVVFVIFLTVLVAQAIPSVKNLKKITSDATQLTDIAANKATDLDGLISDLGSSVHDLSGAMRSNQGFVAAAGHVGKAVSSTISYMKGAEEKQTKRSKKEAEEDTKKRSKFRK